MFGRSKRQIEHILIVEDEPLVAFDTEHFLRGEGFRITATLDSVAAAVEAIGAGGRIDLVLVDVDLADGSGVRVAEMAMARAIPVLFVTGNCPADAQRLAAGCLSKPYAHRDLLAAITALEAVTGGRAPPRRLPRSLRLFAAG